MANEPQESLGEQYVPRNPFEKPPWYKSFWKVITLAILVFVLLIVLIFALMVLGEYQKISRGEASSFSGVTTVDQTAQDQNTGPTTFTVAPTADDDPFIGQEDAKITIIGFEDFQCPFCKEAAPIMEQLVDTYPDDVRFVFRDFPLSNIHPQATEAAMAAECAHEQGRFWLYHNALYDNQSALHQSGIFNSLAEQASLDTEKFDECLSTERYKSEVEQDLDAGLLAGVQATPTFFVDGTPFRGVLSFDQWQQIVEAELQK